MLSLPIQIFWRICYYPFLLGFLGGVFLMNLLAVMVRILPARTANRLMHTFSYALFRGYVAAMIATGNLRTNHRVLDRILPGQGSRRTGALIIANHPSIFDAPLFLSRIPELSCVFKASLREDLFMAPSVKALGHLANDAGMDLLREMSDRLARGSAFLIFPEGTRTENGPVNPFNAGYALAALRARVPVHLVCIHSDTPLLSKRQHFLKAARFPVSWQFQLGPVLQPGDFRTSRELNRFAEDWFRKALATVDIPRPQPCLPVVREVQRNGADLHVALTVPAAPAYCRGHMPGNPIVPGYVQMAWARELLEEEIGRSNPSVQFQRWKFLDPVHPGDRLELAISHRDDRYSVVIEREGGRVSQGLLRLGEGAGS